YLFDILIHIRRRSSWQGIQQSQAIALICTMRQKPRLKRIEVLLQAHGIRNSDQIEIMKRCQRLNGLLQCFLRLDWAIRTNDEGHITSHAPVRKKTAHSLSQIAVLVGLEIQCEVFAMVQRKGLGVTRD